MELNPYQAPASALAVEARRQIELPMASRASRFAARFLDNLILYGVPGVAWLTIAVLGGASGVDEDLTAGIAVLVGVPLWLLIMGINIVMLNNSGQTPGKRIAGIRIVAADGSHPLLWKILVLRMFAPVAINSICGFFGLIDALAIFGADQTCIHDLMADTRVVEAHWDPQNQDTQTQRWG